VIVGATDDVLQESCIGFRLGIRSGTISSCTDWLLSRNHLFVVSPDTRAETALASFLSNSTRYSSVRAVSSIINQYRPNLLLLNGHRTAP